MLYYNCNKWILLWTTQIEPHGRWKASFNTGLRLGEALTPQTGWAPEGFWDMMFGDKNMILTLLPVPSGND